MLHDAVKQAVDAPERTDPESCRAWRFNYLFAKYGEGEHISITRMQLANFRMWEILNSH